MKFSEMEGKNTQLFILNSSSDSFLFRFPFKHFISLGQKHSLPLPHISATGSQIVKGGLFFKSTKALAKQWSSDLLG